MALCRFPLTKMRFLLLDLCMLLLARIKGPPLKLRRLPLARIRGPPSGLCTLLPARMRFPLPALCALLWARIEIPPPEPRMLLPARMPVHPQANLLRPDPPCTALLQATPQLHLHTCQLPLLPRSFGLQSWHKLDLLPAPLLHSPRQCTLPAHSLLQCTPLPHNLRPCTLLAHSLPQRIPLTHLLRSYTLRIPQVHHLQALPPYRHMYHHWLHPIHIHSHHSAPGSEQFLLPGQTAFSSTISFLRSMRKLTIL